MMKSSELVVVVDSVENVIKFYTEKLGFDVVELCTHGKTEQSENALSYGRIKKGKCFISFRLPSVEELAEFSFIKRCVSRSTGLYVEMKKGIEKYFQRCKKKGVQIVEELSDKEWGHKTFAIKDPCGIKLMFAQPIEGFSPKKDPNFLGLSLKSGDIESKSKDKELIEEMSAWLKNFGILRRAAKKYAKLWLQEFRGEK